MLLGVMASCNKDKYTTAPQLKDKGFTANSANSSINFQNSPRLKLEVTDAEGDLGMIPGKDTSKLFIKNTLTGKIDSLQLFPDLSTVSTKNFRADVEISLFTVLGGRSLPPSQRPYRDTLRFEVWLYDFAKNKSNVVTSGPFIYQTL